jgi:hypothetical protein
VVISNATRRLLGQVFELRDLGPMRLKGFGHHVPGFLVAGERPAESRFEAHRSGQLSPMLGRNQELALVLERWRQATAGEGQAVLLVGEAGIGKSRLVRAALEAIAAEEPITCATNARPTTPARPLPMPTTRAWNACSGSSRPLCARLSGAGLGRGCGRRSPMPARTATPTRWPKP